MELTEKQGKLLNNLAELLVYGHEELTKIKLNLKGTSLKKKLLFFMMGATQSYAESMLKIMTPTLKHTSIYANSALVLFRTVLENLMNLSYIYASDTQENAALFHIDWLQSTLKYANKYKKLMIKYPKSKYPKWDFKFGDKLEPNDWDSFITKTQKEIAKWQKRFKVASNSKLPPLEQRCQRHDVYLENKGKLKDGTSLEKLYVTYYPYFSGIAHLTSEGLNSFRNFSPDGSFDLKVDSNIKEIESVIPLTYNFYLTILHFFLQKFGVYDNKKFKQFKKTAKNILNESPSVSANN